MATSPELNFGAKLDLLPALGAVLFTALVALLTGIRRGLDDESSLYLHVLYAATRRLTTRLSAPQLQWFFPSTNAAYERQARMAKMATRTVRLPHGAKGHWIGDPEAQHVLVWYHGGGFSLHALEGHFAYFTRLIQSRQGAGSTLAVLFLEYSLAPAARYPVQLRQAVEALRYLVEETKHTPSQITLGGDSAGGNLVIGVLSHMVHRHESISELTLREPIAAAVMMSPWCVLNDADQNLYASDGADVITALALEHWVDNYMGVAIPDHYTDAMLAPPEWFRGLPTKNILVLAGGNEYLLPSINLLVKNLEAGYGPVEFHVASREAHVAPFINLFYRYSEPTGQGKMLQTWLEKVIS